MKPIKYYKTRRCFNNNNNESNSYVFKLFELFYIIQYILIVLAIYFKLKTNFGFNLLIENILAVYIYILYISLLVCTIVYNVKKKYKFSKSEVHAVLKSWIFCIFNTILLLCHKIESPI